MMQVLIYPPDIYNVEDKHIKQISSLGVSVAIANNREEVLDKIRYAEVLVCGNYNFSKDFLSKADKLKWVHALAAGVDGILPLIPPHIILTHSKGVQDENIAEQVLGYMLIHERLLDKTYNAQLSKKWILDEVISGHAGTAGELKGKVAVIVGLGGIGTRMSELFDVLGMRVIGIRKNTNQRPASVSEIYTPGNILETLKRADYVIVALPQTDETFKLFDKEKFDSMKTSAYFINIGRGATVDEQALIKALKSNKISGAALDVFEEEPLPNSSELWALENVFITPHSAGFTHDIMDRMTYLFITNLKSFLNNQKLPNLVDRSRGY